MDPPEFKKRPNIRKWWTKSNKSIPKQALLSSIIDRVISWPRSAHKSTTWFRKGPNMWMQGVRKVRKQLNAGLNRLSKLDMATNSLANVTSGTRGGETFLKRGGKTSLGTTHCALLTSACMRIRLKRAQKLSKSLFQPSTKVTRPQFSKLSKSTQVVSMNSSLLWKREHSESYIRGGNKLTSLNHLPKCNSQSCLKVMKWIGLDPPLILSCALRPS